MRSKVQVDPVINPSKLRPCEYRVLLRMEKVDEKIGSVFIPPDERDRLQLAETKSTIMAVGANAFEDWKPPVPKVGDKAYISKYAGLAVKGEDGRDYRIVNDKELQAIIEDGGEEA